MYGLLLQTYPIQASEKRWLVCKTRQEIIFKAIEQYMENNNGKQHVDLTLLVLEGYVSKHETNYPSNKDVTVGRYIYHPQGIGISHGVVITENIQNHSSKHLGLKGLESIVIETMGDGKTNTKLSNVSGILTGKE